MKRIGSLFLLLILLCGCSEGRGRIDRALALRRELLKNSCTFTAEITADYGEKCYTFTLDCTGDALGNVTFSVTQPDTIAGICGNLTGEGGYLTFDDAALGFDLLAEGQVSPVSAPWLLLKTLQGGYLTSAGEDGERLRLTIDDSYEEDALQLDVWLDGDDIPVEAEILYAGRKILSMTIRDFRIG